MEVVGLADSSLQDPRDFSTKRLDGLFVADGEHRRELSKADKGRVVDWLRWRHLGSIGPYCSR